MSTSVSTANPVSFYPGRTGNPFVDWGLAVAAAMKSLDGADSVTAEIMRDVVGDGVEIAKRHQVLKSFNLVFGSNTPLHNPKKPKPGERHVQAYARILKQLADLMGSEARLAPCEICGAPKTLTDIQVPRKEMQSTDSPAGDEGTKKRKRKKETAKPAEPAPWLGRDWFPLAGAKTEANMLPAGSRAIHACARCLLAVRLLPDAVMLVDGQACILQSAPPTFADHFAADLFEQVRDHCLANDHETIGAKEGTRALMRRLLSVVSRFHSRAELGVIDRRTRLFAWKFSNAGDSASATVEEIPNRALLFLWKTAHLRLEIEKLVGEERGKDTDRNPSLLRCLEHGLDYGGLYPRAKASGASPELFAMYQVDVLGRTAKALSVARDIAAATVAKKTKKEVTHLRKPEAVRSSALRFAAKQKMFELAARGDFTIGDYRSLFPTEIQAGVNANPGGWKVLWYYLHYPEAAVRPESGEGPVERGVDLLCVLADRMLARLLTTRSCSQILDSLLSVSGSIGPAWLITQFEQCAAIEEGFTYKVWRKLAFDEGGSFRPWEWIFQSRLRMASVLGSGEPVQQAALVNDSVLAQASLPWEIAESLEGYLRWYVTERGTARLNRDIVQAWLSRRLSVEQVGERLQSRDVAGPLDRDAWTRWYEAAEPFERRIHLGLGLLNASRRLATFHEKDKIA